MADSKEENPELAENRGRDSTGSNGATAADRTKEIDRARLVRERQNEERQRKLEEMRQQALAARRFREQLEEERRKRIEELRVRDYDRRSQVEERKRLIWEAERERREAILRKNQEREARIEAKRKNERSQIVFAFGSSTPRMLEPADTGSATFWGTRRATSTTNVMTFSATAVPLTRRSSERELDGSKKRATSAGGLDRKPGEGEETDATFLGGSSIPGTPAAGCSSARFANRRRTDLMPTIPSPRDSSAPTSGRSSSAGKAFSRSPGIRSGEATPNSPSRPHSSMSQQSASSSVASSSVNLRPRTGTPRRPRPASIAGTGVSVSSCERNNANSDPRTQKDSKPPLPKVHHSTPKKPSTPSAAASGNKTGAAAKSDKPTPMAKASRASPRVTPKATPLQSPGVEQQPLLEIKELKPAKDEEPKQSERDEMMDVDDEKIAQVTQESIVTESTKDETKMEVEESHVAESSPMAAIVPPVKEELSLIEEDQPAPVPEKKAAPKIEKKSPEPEPTPTKF